MSREALSLRTPVTPAELAGLLGAPAVRAAGGHVHCRQGPDAAGRLRLQVSGPGPEQVAAARDALLAEARQRGWRLLLVQCALAWRTLLTLPGGQGSTRTDAGLRPAIGCGTWLTHPDGRGPHPSGWRPRPEPYARC
jgi:hypothetical protein